MAILLNLVKSTRDNARKAPRMSIRHNRTSMFVSHLVYTSLTWCLVTKNPLSGHSLYVSLVGLHLRNSSFGFTA